MSLEQLLFGVGIFIGRGGELCGLFCFCFFPCAGGVKPCTWKKVKFVWDFLLQEVYS